MELSDFVRIHSESGFPIEKWNGSYFLNRGLINYSFPQLVEIPVDKKGLNLLRWKHLITVIKMDHRIKNTYEYILQTQDYGLETFRKKTRPTIRKSLRACVFKRPLLEELLKDGLRINRETLKLQSRDDKFLTDSKLWGKYISLFYNMKDVKILGAYIDGKMIGYALAYQMGARHYFHLQHIDRQYATYYPMSGLMYEIINQIIEENGSVHISDGIESFNPMPSLNRFKRYMRFERVPVTRVYVLHPVLVVFLKPVVFCYLKIMGKRNVRNQFMRKAIDLYHGHRVLSRII